MAAVIEAFPVADKRITARLGEDVADEMSELALTEGIPVSDRIAALAELWRTDSEVRSRADEVARTIAAQRRQQRYDRGQRSP